MKQFSISRPIVEFPIRCPQDKSIHSAAVHAFCAANTQPVFKSVECHKSYECDACRKCLSCVSLAFLSDQEPDDFSGPLDPRLLPDWKV